MKKTITLLVLLFTVFVNAQDGTLDTTFGINGMKNYTDFGLNAVISDMQIDDNNKILVTGTLTNSSGTNRQWFVCRFTEDGTFDATFNGNGKRIISNVSSATFNSNLLLAEDNKFYVCGNASAIYKINNDGSLDTTFGTSGFLSISNSAGNPVKISITDTNKLVVAKQINLQSTGVRVYNSNGQIDTGFNSNSEKFLYVANFNNYNLMGVNVDNSNNIYVYGNGTDGLAYCKIISVSGADVTFGITNSTSLLSSGNSNMIFDFADNTSYYYGMGTNQQFTITKNTATGTIDNSFGTNGVANFDFSGFAFDNATNITGHEYGTNGDFKILLSGRIRENSSGSSQTNIGITRLFSNGILDTSFGTNGFVNLNTTVVNGLQFNTPMIINYDLGKLYLIGLTNYDNVRLYRFNLSSVLSTNEIINKKGQIKIYPNPASNFVSIQILENTIENFEYKIVDLTGRIVKNGNSKFNEQINIESLTSGNYIIQIETESGEKFTQKLIKN